MARFDGVYGGGDGGGGDEFAFSGAKTTTLNVLPVSRRTVTYRLLPLVRGAWIRPHLVVRDKYFQKVLRVVPTEGLKGDKEGVLIWVPPVDEEEDEEEDDESESGSGSESRDVKKKREPVGPHARNDVLKKRPPRQKPWLEQRPRQQNGVNDAEPVMRKCRRCFEDRR